MMAEPQLLAPELRRQVRQLDDFGPSITVHAASKTVQTVSSICAQADIGAVYTISPSASDKSRLTTATDTVKHHVGIVGSADAVLLDAQHYRGKSWRRGTEPHDLSWTAHQHGLGQTWALTDSGYIAEGDDRALDNTLSEGAQHKGRTLVALPLHHTWLSKRADLLRRKIEAAGLPVALMLGHRDDPFGSRRGIVGLLEILRSDAKVAVLRCDLSAIGALANGAVLGAIGTTTTLRHIYPPDANGFGRQAQPAAFVRRVLQYKQLEKIREAARADPDEIKWLCECSYCAGRMLSWLIDEEDAFRHSLVTIAELTGHVLSSTNPRTTWQALCRSAQFDTLDIAQLGLKWEPEPVLGHWVNC